MLVAQHVARGAFGRAASVVEGVGRGEVSEGIPFPHTPHPPPPTPHPPPPATDEIHFPTLPLSVLPRLPTSSAAPLAAVERPLSMSAHVAALGNATHAFFALRDGPLQRNPADARWTHNWRAAGRLREPPQLPMTVTRAGAHTSLPTAVMDLAGVHGGVRCYTNTFDHIPASLACTAEQSTASTLIVK
jgi:hypothetical protein